MSEEKINIVVSLKDNASKGVKSFSDSLSKLSTTAKVAVAAGLGAIAKVLYDCVKAFGESETATKGLESALRSTGQEVKDNTKRLTDFANKMQSITTIEDDVVVGLLKTGIAMGLTADESERAAQEAIGLSAAFGVDLESGMKAAVAAGEGNYALMQRMIPSLRGITDKTILAAEAQRLMAAGFQQAQDQTQTLNGAMLQLKNSVNSAQETIGSVFAPVIQKVAMFIKDIVEKFNALDPAMQKNIVIIGTISAVVIALIPVLGILAGAIAAISWPVLAVVAGVAALSAGFLILRNEVNAVGGVGNLIKNVYLSWFQMMLGGFQNLLLAAKKFIDILNKIPGINIPIDEAIAGIDKLQEKLEEHKVKRQEDNAAELEEAKVHEENKLLIKQEAQVASEEWKATIDEAEKAKKDQELEEFKNRLTFMSDAEIAKAGFTQQQIMAIQNLRSKQAEALSKSYIDYVGKAAEEEKDIAKAVARGTLEFIKDGIKKQILAKAAEISETGFALLLASLGTDPQAYAHIAAGGVLAAGGVAAVNSIQMAEGGIVQPRPGGTQATIGEAGSAEAVIPLDDPQATSMLGGGGNNISVNISGKPLAKEMYEIQQEMIRTGELEA